MITAFTLRAIPALDYKVGPSPGLHDEDEFRMSFISTEAVMMEKSWEFPGFAECKTLLTSS